MSAKQQHLSNKNEKEERSLPSAIEHEDLLIPPSYALLTSTLDKRANECRVLSSEEKVKLCQFVIDEQRRTSARRYIFLFFLYVSFYILSYYLIFFIGDTHYTIIISSFQCRLWSAIPSWLSFVRDGIAFSTSSLLQSPLWRNRLLRLRRDSGLLSSLWEFNGIPSIVRRRFPRMSHLRRESL